MLAYHESGQALMATEQVPEDRYNMNRSYLSDRLCVMLGGREAEKLIFGEVSTGAEQDLKHATRFARRMVLNWNMSERLEGSGDTILKSLRAKNRFRRRR